MSEEYNEGYRASENGELYTSNPYRYKTKAHEEWAKGYLACDLDFSQSLVKAEKDEPFFVYMFALVVLMVLIYVIFYFLEKV